MGIKRRNKANSEFSMSSLTDIIFLLLIFFMLTSSLVAPNALNLKLPGSSSKTPPSTSKIDDVRIGSTGNFYLNGSRLALYDLEKELRSMSRSKRDLAITISPSDRSPVEAVAQVMDIALRLNINAILAAEE